MLSAFPAGAEISYAIIPQIPNLPEPLRSQVRAAFASSIQNIWYTGIGLSALGLLLTLPAKALVLAVVTDENWAIDRANETAPGERNEDTDLEAAKTNTTIQEKTPEKATGGEKNAVIDLEKRGTNVPSSGVVTRGEILMPTGASL